MNTRMFLAAVAVSSLTVTSASADMIGLNVRPDDRFGGWNYHGEVGANAADTAKEAGLVNQGNWNNLDRAEDHFNGATSYDLVDNTGADSGADLVVNASFNWFTYNNVENNGADNGLSETDRNNLRLLGGFDGLSGGSSGTIFSVSGITYDTYDVIVYLANDGEGRTGSVEVGGTTYYYEVERGIVAEERLVGGGSAWNVGTNTDSQLTPLANVLVFENVSGSTLNINHASIAGNSGIGGFQIVEVPEPGSLALLGLGGLAVLRRRRG